MINELMNLTDRVLARHFTPWLACVNPKPARFQFYPVLWTVDARDGSHVQFSALWGESGPECHRLG